MEYEVPFFYKKHLKTNVVHINGFHTLMLVKYVVALHLVK